MHIETACSTIARDNLQIVNNSSTRSCKEILMALEIISSPSIMGKTVLRKQKH